MKMKKLSELTKQEFKSLQISLGRDSQIAKYLNISRQAVSQHKKRLGIKSSKEYSEIRNKKIIRDYNNGAKVDIIKEYNGLSKSCVYKILNKNGIGRKYNKKHVQYKPEENI